MQCCCEKSNKAARGTAVIAYLLVKIFLMPSVEIAAYLRWDFMKISSIKHLPAEAPFLYWPESV
jgi:TRAP-type mannitol/chloroaromatic compound transport system permease small subunit